MGLLQRVAVKWVVVLSIGAFSGVPIVACESLCCIPVEFHTEAETCCPDGCTQSAASEQSCCFDGDCKSTPFAGFSLHGFGGERWQGTALAAAFVGHTEPAAFSAPLGWARRRGACLWQKSLASVYRVLRV